MLVSWEKRAGGGSGGEAKGSKDVFQGLVADFWEGLGRLFVQYVDNEEADPQALEGVSNCLEVSLSLEKFCF